MRRLAEKVAIVTGAGSGIGRAVAVTLAAEGASVLVADLDADSAGTVVDEIRDAGGVAASCCVDVAQEASVREMVDRAVREFGGVDILHNNAAAVGLDVIGRDGAITDLDVDVWDTTMSVNARGVMLGCKHAIPHMIDRHGGSIINTVSGSGFAGATVRSAYGSSKGAVMTFTRYVATSYGKQGVRCNAVSPGLILTATTRRNLPAAHLEIYEQNCPYPRLGEAQDIANTVLFLASEESAFINGETIRVDGGTLAHHPAHAQLVNLRSVVHP